MDKQIVNNKVTKFDTISDAYISFPLRLKPKPYGGWQ